MPLTDSDTTSNGLGKVCEPKSADQPANRIVLTIIPILTVLTLDIITKAWVMATFELYERRSVIGDFFRFTFST